MYAHIHNQVTEFTPDLSLNYLIIVIAIYAYLFHISFDQQHEFRKFLAKIRDTFCSHAINQI